MRYAAVARRLLLMIILLLAGALCIPGFAAAQGESGTAFDALNGPTRQKLLDARAELQALRHQLAQIAAAALRHNPSLQEQQEELRNLVLNTMKAAGYEPDKEVAHIKKLTSKLRSESIDAEQRKHLIADYQQTQARLLAAQRGAMDDEEVRQAQQTYRNQILQAMKEENPASEALLQHYQKARMEFQHALEKAVKSQDKGD